MTEEPPERQPGLDADRAIFSWQLATASSVEERKEIWEQYLQDNPEQFENDCEKATELLLSGDLNGLVEHASRFAKERAAVRAAVIRRDPGEISRES